MTNLDMANEILEAINNLKDPLSIIAGTYDAGWRCPDDLPGAKQMNEVMASASQLMETFSRTGREFNIANDNDEMTGARKGSS